MNKVRTVVFLLLAFLPLEIATPFAFKLALTTTDNQSFFLSLFLIFGVGAITLPWEMMTVTLIRRIYGNMDAYLFDGDQIKIQVYHEHLESGKTVPKSASFFLTFGEYLQLRLLARLKLLSPILPFKRGESLSAENRFYIRRCRFHNIYFLSYGYGRHGMFRCPMCWIESGLAR